MAKVKHVVVIKFKEGTSTDQIDQLFNGLLELTESFPGIEDYVAGANISTEGLSGGFTHGLVMTFKDVAARDEYLPHPDHERVKASFLAHIESAVVLDFEV